VISELDRAEHDVEQHSVALKKPLGLRDLVLTQILFVVGSSCVGAARNLDKRILLLAARYFAFLHSQAAFVIYLNGQMPLEGGFINGQSSASTSSRGLSWLGISAAFDHGYCIGWDVYDDEYFLRNRSERRMDAEQQMVCVADQRRIGRRPRMDVRSGLSLGQMASQRGRIAMLVVYGALIFCLFWASRAVN